MIEDMIQIKLAVEGMKVQIVKAFDAQEISKAVRKATEKAVDAFDMDSYIKSTVEAIFNRARETAISQVSQKYGEQWASDLSVYIDSKIAEAINKGIVEKD